MTVNLNFIHAKLREENNCVVKSVQLYSPSGIFSDKICACNPLNRMAKVIRRSIAITANQSARPSVSCANREKVTNFRKRLLCLSRCRDLVSHKMCRCLSFVFSFFFLLFSKNVYRCRGCLTGRDNSSECVYFCFSLLSAIISFLFLYYSFGYYCCCLSSPLSFPSNASFSTSYYLR